jgi:predicted O-methyltransferase YrrM
MTNIAIDINASVLNAIDMSAYKQYVRWTKVGDYFDQTAGSEFYRLLAHLARQMPPGSTLVDIGTYCGLSALALSMNEACDVMTYEVYDQIPESSEDVKTIRDVGNITYLIKDALTDPNILSVAKIIVIDVDPHDGVQEAEFMAALRGMGYQGLVVLDDIRLNDQMKTFWTNIPERKYDLTQYGHWSGTGVVCLSPEYTFTLS